MIRTRYRGIKKASDNIARNLDPFRERELGFTLVPEAASWM